MSASFGDPQIQHQKTVRITYAIANASELSCIGPADAEAAPTSGRPRAFQLRRPGRSSLLPSLKVALAFSPMTSSSLSKINVIVPVLLSREGLWQGLGCT